MKRVIILAVLILLICSSYSLAAVPCKINYQGRLIKDNVPVNGPVNMEFKLYNQATSGTLIKTITINNVQVFNGLFRALLDLGDVDWTAGETIYLEIKAGTDTLSPREPIYAYPYAINSHFLEGKTTAHFLDVSSSTQTKQGGLNIMGKVGIGDDSPQSPLTVGSGDAFQVNSSGDPIKIKNVTYSWPSAQGGLNTVLTNNSSGGLSWAGGISTLKKTADQIINGIAFQDITGLTFAVSANTDYAFKFYIVYRSAVVTGFRFAINGPTGAVCDYFMTYQTIANSTAAGVATWLQGHWVGYDAMTALTVTIAAGADLVCIIEGRIKVGATSGTLAARVASGAANNDLVIQKGSWGTYF